MKVTPDDYGRRCQFDHFCKLVLYHEAVDYFRERKRQRGWETSFETLPLSELDTLCTIDQYAATRAEVVEILGTGHAMHDRLVPQRQFYISGLWL